MSVLCCTIPNFLLNLAYQHQPGWADHPLALLGPDERVCALSAQAAHAQVQLQMTPRQAQLRCPELRLRPLDLAASLTAQQALISTLAAWGLPVEECDWGRAYLALHTVAPSAAQVQPLAAALGQQLRQVLGLALQPALGWDTGKFTAHAAAAHAAPGRMKLISADAEARFLAPLPINLLPLPPADQQQLHWLGIHTLGQFAQLPPAAVWQRFGSPGQLAQRWAQGRDDRPVQPTAHPAGPPLQVDIDPPSANLPWVVATLLAALRPQLHALTARLAGLRRLHLQLAFTTGDFRTVELLFLTPISAETRLTAALTHHLQRLVWPGAATRATVLLMQTGELAAHQLALFPDLVGQTATSDLAHQLAQRYGPIFFQATRPDPHHPIAERRTVYTPLP